MVSIRDAAAALSSTINNKIGKKYKHTWEASRGVDGAANKGFIRVRMALGSGVEPIRVIRIRGRFQFVFLFFLPFFFSWLLWTVDDPVDGIREWDRGGWVASGGSY